MATRVPDEEALAIIVKGAARIALVSDEEIAAAIRAYWSDTHNLAEGAGAAALAAAMKERSRLQGRKVGLVLSGGNIDLDLFQRWVATAPERRRGLKLNTRRGARRAPNKDLSHEQDLDRLSASPYSSAIARSNIETHTLSVLVDNEPGVLARVVGMFSGRGYNIESLTVAEVAHETHLSRITIVTSGTPEIIEQIRHQLERLVPVHSVTDLTLTVRAIERELAMIKVRGKGENRVEAMQPRRSLPRQGDRRDDRELHFRIDRRAAQDRRFRRTDAPDRPRRSVAHRRRRDLARAGADLAPRP